MNRIDQHWQQYSSKAIPNYVPEWVVKVMKNTFFAAFAIAFEAFRKILANAETPEQIHLEMTAIQEELSDFCLSQIKKH